MQSHTLIIDGVMDPVDCPAAIVKFLRRFLTNDKNPPVLVRFEMREVSLAYNMR